MTRWVERFAAVDWGSTARRVYVLDETGHVVNEVEDEAGTLTIAGQGFASEVESLRTRIGDMPLLLAGMIGSNRGWMEAPYVPCPATLPQLAERLLWAEPGRAAIVPGVSLIEQGRGDVMRGEEVQVFGALKLQPARTRLTICHPGTHTKWIEVESDTIVRFRTVMTGELFALLRKHSILADVLANPMTVGPAFKEGVDRGFAGAGLGAELFSIRAGVLLGLTRREAAPAYASGLLIGCDLRTGLADVPKETEILVLGRGSLTSLYATAIEGCGYTAVTMDGGEAFVAGMRAIAETIR